MKTINDIIDLINKLRKGPEVALDNLNESNELMTFLLHYFEENTTENLIKFLIGTALAVIGICIIIAIIKAIRIYNRKF